MQQQAVRRIKVCALIEIYPPYSNRLNAEQTMLATDKSNNAYRTCRNALKYL